MPGAFSPILPPPQSIDSIDAWGDLDDLPYSLDSARWDVIGLYKIVVTDVVKTTGEADVWRVLMLTCAGISISGGEVWPEYKGWAWTREAQMEQGWSPILGTEQDWRQIPGSTSDWRGIVEWQ